MIYLDNSGLPQVNPLSPGILIGVSQLRQRKYCVCRGLLNWGGIITVNQRIKFAEETQSCDEVKHSRGRKSCIKYAIIQILSEDINHHITHFPMLIFSQTILNKPKIS